MWELIEAVELRGATPIECMREVGDRWWPSADGEAYVERWGRAILAWCELFA